MNERVVVLAAAALMSLFVTYGPATWAQAVELRVIFFGEQLKATDKMCMVGGRAPRLGEIVKIDQSMAHVSLESSPGDARRVVVVNRPEIRLQLQCTAGQFEKVADCLTSPGQFDLVAQVGRGEYFIFKFQPEDSETLASIGQSVKLGDANSGLFDSACTLAADEVELFMASKPGGIIFQPKAGSSSGVWVHGAWLNAPFSLEELEKSADHHSNLPLLQHLTRDTWANRQAAARIQISVERGDPH
jgi:hypothetical protein